MTLFEIAVGKKTKCCGLVQIFVVHANSKLAFQSSCWKNVLPKKVNNMAHFSGLSLRTLFSVCLRPKSVYDKNVVWSYEHPSLSPKFCILRKAGLKLYNLLCNEWKETCLSSASWKRASLAKVVHDKRMGTKKRVLSDDHISERLGSKFHLPFVPVSKWVNTRTQIVGGFYKKWVRIRQH